MLFLKDPAKVSTLQRLEADKVYAAESVGGKITLTLLVGFGVFIATANPLFGAIAGGFPALSMMRGLKRGAERKQFYRRSGGALAHLLDESELVQLVKQIGLEEVKRQLCAAIEHGQELTDDAEALANQIIDKRPATTIAEMLAELDAKPLSEDELIDVPAEVVTEKPVIDELSVTQATPQKMSVNTQGQQDSVPTVLDTVTDSPGISRLMIGGQRTGKSYFAAVASRVIATLLGWKVFHINLASYGDEDSYYWQHAYRSVCGDLPSITNEQQAQDLISSAIDAITEFISTPYSLLIVDEITFTGSKYGKWDTSGVLRLVAEQISALTSSGAKRERAIWALCPELVASAIKDSAKVIKSLKLMYFAVTPSMTIDWKGQKFAFDSELHSQVCDNFDRVPMPTAEQLSLCRRHNLPRVIYMMGEWWPLEALPEIPKVVATAPAVEAPPEVKPIAPIEDPELLSLFAWLKGSGRRSLTVESLRNSHWAKKAQARSTARAQSILDRAVEAGLLLAKTNGEYVFAVSADTLEQMCARDIPRDVPDVQGHP
jgi:hypothetical protein